MLALLLACLATPADGPSCKTLAAQDQPSGMYFLDPGGDGDAFPALCENERNGGGWTLIAVNAWDGEWDAEQLTARRLLPVDQDDRTNTEPTLERSYKSLAFYSLAFRDLRVASGDQEAVYAGVDFGTQSWLDFQDAVPMYNCWDDGYNWPMEEGNLDHPALCSTDLHVNVADTEGTWLDCGTENAVVGPAWSTANNDGCPLDDPSASSFLADAESATNPWGFDAPLTLWVR